jgi:hypothetical protein
VRQRILDLADVARERGDTESFLDALKEFHRRLCIYPQFGDPLSDLVQESGQIRVGIVRPLSMRYTVIDDPRVVMVTALPVLLQKAKSQFSE